MFFILFVDFHQKRNVYFRNSQLHGKYIQSVFSLYAHRQTQPKKKLFLVASPCVE